MHELQKLTCVDYYQKKFHLHAVLCATSGDLQNRDTGHALIRKPMQQSAKYNAVVIRDVYHSHLEFTLHTFLTSQLYSVKKKDQTLLRHKFCDSRKEALVHAPHPDNFFLSLSTDEIIPAILLVFLLFKFCKHCVKFLSEDKFCEPRYIRICPGSTECHFNQYKGFTIVGLMSKRKNCTIALRLKSSGVSPAIGFVFKFRMFHVKFLIVLSG